MTLSLLVSSGINEGELLRVERVRLLIGRGPQCHVRPNSPEVDLQHCGFFVRGNSAFLRDLDSKTGTLLNGRRLRGEIELRDGDLVQVGPLTLAVILEPEPLPPRIDGRPLPGDVENIVSQDSEGEAPAMEEAAAAHLENGEAMQQLADTLETPPEVDTEGPSAETQPEPEVAPPAPPAPRAARKTQIAGRNGRRTQLAVAGTIKSRAPT
jgi:pSer/pThr/pTyr-binding forkhead associated (FHA) protein